MDDQALFDMEAVLGEKPKPITDGVIFRERQWTGNKAKLIARYLWYFTWVTRHGTYLDLFAGPQNSDRDNSWAAKLALENRPRWLQRLAFFEKSSRKIRMLEELKGSQPPKERREPNRVIDVIPGDCNQNLPIYLAENPVKRKAAFCLLDQRTFECDWDTVKAVAQHKSNPRKIEQFYFLAEKWLARAGAKRRVHSPDRLDAWWGGKDWGEFFNATAYERAEMVANRFRNELGYQYVVRLPIYQARGSNTLMFWMIHASDHQLAPQLMLRAYNRAVEPYEPMDQVELEFGPFADLEDADGEDTIEEG